MLWWRRLPGPWSWGSGLFAIDPSRAPWRLWQYLAGNVCGWMYDHVVARAALSSSDRTVGTADHLRQIGVPGALAPAPAGAPLYAAHRRAVARGRSHHAAARHRARARDFAQQHGGWIAARLKRLPEAAPFLHGVEVPLRGIPHRIVHRRGVRGTVWTETDDRGQRLICVAGEPPHLDRRIGDFLKREARRDLEAAASRYAAKLGIAVKRISIRDQSSRWGSCSNTGVLSFSWRLILAPGFVLDYLAAHEVAHLKELNHSPRFWRLVGKLDAVLIYFKYAAFFIQTLGAVFGGLRIPHPEIILPLGISFIVFEKITYIVDVYRGTTPPARNVLDYLLFVFFFPKMLSGPIIKNNEISETADPIAAHCPRRR